MASGGLAGFGVFDSDGTTRVGYMTGTASNMELWAQSNIPMNFGTNDTQRMRITAGGNLLIGTTTDVGYKLDVNGTGIFRGALALKGNNITNTFIDAANSDYSYTLQNYSSQFRLYNDTAGATVINFAANRQVQISA
jgi:hypothetical protein